MRLKQRLRPVVYQTARALGVLRVMERRLRRGVTLLTYHHVLPDAECDDYALRSLVMPLSAFRAQVAWLATHCRVATVSEALSHTSATEQAIVCLTFDDGYLDNYRHAAPVLREHGVFGTFYVTVDPIEKQTLLWFDRACLLWRTEGADACAEALAAVHPSASRPGNVNAWVARLKQIPGGMRDDLLSRLEARGPGLEPDSASRLMTIAQVRELAETGHEIGSHTMTHPILPALDDRAQVAELVESKTRLEQWLGSPVHGLCYPNGDFDPNIERQVANAGYQHACTTLAGTNPFPVGERQRLKRRDLVPTRVLDPKGRPNELSFRSELCGLRERWR